MSHRKPPLVEIKTSYINAKKGAAIKPPKANESNKQKAILVKIAIPLFGSPPKSLMKFWHPPNTAKIIGY